MKAICFMQEVKEGDLTIREQMLVCRRALRKLRWPCVLELFAQAGTEEQPLSLRPGMVELLHAAANGEADVLVVVDPMRLPRATFWEIDSLSACAKALSTVRIISEFMVAVLIFSFSNTTAIPICFSIRTYWILSSVLRANREIDFVRIRSILCFLQS